MRKIRKFENMPINNFRPFLSSVPESIPPYDHQEARLFIEFGQKHFACFVVQNNTNTIIEYEVYQLDVPFSELELLDFFKNHQFDKNDFSAVVIIHNTKEFVLIPSELHKTHLEKTTIETIHGDLTELELLNDNLSKWEMTNVFGVHKSQFQLINELFPSASHLHINSIYLKAIFKQLMEMQEEWVKMYFYPSYFNVVVIKDTQVQIMQSFYYETPEDVIYFLLTLTEQFNLDVTTLVMQISGLIEKDSITYKELTKYFLNIELESDNITRFLINEEDPTPSHYFTPLFLSAQCV